MTAESSAEPNLRLEESQASHLSGARRAPLQITIHRVNERTIAFAPSKRSAKKRDDDTSYVYSCVTGRVLARIRRAKPPESLGRRIALEEL